MPAGDRTGPEGRGPRTGRAMGYCSGNDRPGYMEPGFRGRGFGRGRGANRGFGRGFGFGRMAGQPYEPTYEQPVELTKEQKLKILGEEQKQIEAELAEIKKEIQVIKK